MNSVTPLSVSTSPGTQPPKPGVQRWRPSYIWMHRAPNSASPSSTLSTLNTGRARGYGSSPRR